MEKILNEYGIDVIRNQWNERWNEKKKDEKEEIANLHSGF